MQVISCSCRGSKINLAVIFWEALGKSAREACAVVAPVPVQSFLNAVCSDLGEKIEIKKGKISISIHLRDLFVFKMDLSPVKGSVSAWKEIFHFVLFTGEAEGMKMWIPRSDPLMSF